MQKYTHAHKTVVSVMHPEIGRAMLIYAGDAGDGITQDAAAWRWWQPH